MASSKMLRPLYLWQLIHFPWNEVSGSEDEVVHYLVLPSNDKGFVREVLGLKNWLIRGASPSEYNLLDQVSNLVCFSDKKDCFPTEVESLQFYDPRSFERQNFYKEES